MNNSQTSRHILDYRELRKEGWAVLTTDSASLVFTLRDSYMIDVFDLDSSAHVAYLDFDIKQKIMLGDAFGSPAIGLPFTNPFRKAFGKDILPFNDLRCRHHVGFFVERAYRNKGKKCLWNMDEVMMAMAITTPPVNTSLINITNSGISSTSPRKRLMASPGDSGSARAPGRRRMYLSRFLRSRVLT